MSFIEGLTRGVAEFLIGRPSHDPDRDLEKRRALGEEARRAGLSDASIIIMQREKFNIRDPKPWQRDRPSHY